MSMSAPPVGGSTGIDHESSAEIDEAASWLAGQSQPPSPVLPSLRRRFNLSPMQAVQVIREAKLLRARAH